MLKVVVCVKAVPDPGEADKIKIDPVTKSLTRLGMPLALNLLDRHALEAALQLKAQQGAHVTVISMGPAPAGDIVRECLALGADAGILLSDKAFAGADAYATALTLAKAIERLSPVDIVICGRASSDGATEWVGPELSVFLKLPVVTMVQEFAETEGKVWRLKAEIENGYRLVQVELPAVVTVTQEANMPKTLSLSGIVRARKKEILTWDLDDLGLPPATVGLAGSPTRVAHLNPVQSKRACEILSGTLDERADGLISRLSGVGAL